MKKIFILVLILTFPTNLFSKESKEFQGIKTITGKLLTTKGDRPLINGIIILDDIYLKPESRHAWKDEYKKLIGKNVKIRGELYLHSCAPFEQCMNTGVIKYLKNVDFIIPVKHE